MCVEDKGWNENKIHFSATDSQLLVVVVVHRRRPPTIQHPSSFSISLLSFYCFIFSFRLIYCWLPALLCHVSVFFFKYLFYICIIYIYIYIHDGYDLLISFHVFWVTKWYSCVCEWWVSSFLYSKWMLCGSVPCECC